MWSAVGENRMLHAHFTHLCVTVIVDWILTLRRHPLSVYLLWTFYGPVTLTLTRWPSYTNLHRITWRCTGCANMNFLRQGFRKLSSDRQTNRHTESTDIIYQAASRVVNNLPELTAVDNTRWHRRPAVADPGTVRDASTFSLSMFLSFDHRTMRS